MMIVELADIAAFDSELLTSLQKRPDDQLRLFEAAACDVLQKSIIPTLERTPTVFYIEEPTHCLQHYDKDYIFMNNNRPWRIWCADSSEINTACNSATITDSGARRETSESVWDHCECASQSVAIWVDQFVHLIAYNSVRCL